MIAAESQSIEDAITTGVGHSDVFAVGAGLDRLLPRPMQTATRVAAAGAQTM